MQRGKSICKDLNSAACGSNSGIKILTSCALRIDGVSLYPADSGGGGGIDGY